METSAEKRFKAPSAIAATTSALTAPNDSIMSDETPSNRVFTAL
jgi:hypothetical protein